MNSSEGCSVSMADTTYGTNYTVTKDVGSTNLFIPWPTECPPELVKYLHHAENARAAMDTHGFPLPSVEVEVWNNLPSFPSLPLSVPLPLLFYTFLPPSLFLSLPTPLLCLSYKIVHLYREAIYM